MSNAQEESLRDRKKTLRRHLMLEIARGLIAANGLRSLKVRDVAEAADCSIGSVYNESRPKTRFASSTDWPRPT